MQNNPFWFHQGYDLVTFNMIDATLKEAFKYLFASHPNHSLPETLEDWEKHLKMTILTYGSYFQAFNSPNAQLVGGADVVSLKWPED